MRVNPSVVVGLGSTGCYVLANLERILYEVMNDAPVDLFRLVSIDTDTTRKEDEPPPGGKRGITVSAHEPNAGQAIRNLKNALGEDFDWCPTDLRIAGPGAGNLRSGGRLLFFNKFAEIWQVVQDSVFSATNAAFQESTVRVLQDQLVRRGLNIPADLVDPSQAVVYVTGTLAGGTGSGMCIDMGYTIHDAAPQATRVGVFLLPARNAAPVFLENTWAALKDLEFFCDDPSAFNAVWKAATGAKHRCRADGVLPYDYVYLISSVNEQNVLKMQYNPSSSAPLTVMASMHLAAELLGMHEHVAASHVNMTNQIQTRPKNRFFLNYNLRVVSYPKYELTEAAACRIIADSICASWLDRNGYTASGMAQPIKEEDVRALGRKRWNERFESVWRGLSGSVELAQWIDKLIQKSLSDPSAELHYQLTSPAQGTIYSQVAQILPTRRLELKKLVREGMGRMFEQTQNLRYVELYVEGIKEELDHTIRFWDALGTPSRNDQDSWASMARTLVHSALAENWTARALGSREELLADELDKLLTRLKMYLMKQTLAEVLAWLNGELMEWMVVLRRSLEAVRDAALRRADTLANQMRESTGPILRLARSKAETLEAEVQALANVRLSLEKPPLNIQDGDLTGVFAVKQTQEVQDNYRIFLALKNELQPRLLRSLEEKGSVDVVRQIRDQDRTVQVISHFNDTTSMSLSTRLSLEKNPAAVPSFIVARDEATANLLYQDMQARANILPVNRKALPMFDHMVIFYQEGACSVQPGAPYHSLPDDLTDAPVYKEHFDAKLRDRADNLDPLRQMKSRPAAAPEGGREQ